MAIQHRRLRLARQPATIWVETAAVKEDRVVRAVLHHPAGELRPGQACARPRLVTVDAANLACFVCGEPRTAVSGIVNVVLTRP